MAIYIERIAKVVAYNGMKIIFASKIWPLIEFKNVF